MNTRILILLSAVCLLSSCNKDDNHAEEPENWPDMKLAGTQWKLAGAVDQQSGALVELSPTGCEQCYTLTFDSDTAGAGYSASNRLELKLRPEGVSVWKKLTDPAETDDGDLFLDAARSASSYALADGELKFFYEKNGKKQYLLYKETHKDPVNYPVEVAAVAFALPSGCSWNYAAMEPGVFIINSQEELQKRISCKEAPPSGIDFDKYSLLLAYGESASKVLKQSARVIREADNTFRMEAEVKLGITAVVGFWTVARLIPKTPQCSEALLNVNIIQGGYIDEITVAKGEFNYKDWGYGYCRLDAAISNEAGWQSLINRFKRGFMYDKTPPVFEIFDESEIDFSSNLLLVVYDKIRNNCGWSIDITEVREDADNITITVQNLKKGNEELCGRYQPFHIIKIPASKKKLVFERETEEEGIPFTVYSLEGTKCRKTG